VVLGLLGVKTEESLQGQQQKQQRVKGSSTPQ